MENNCFRKLAFFTHSKILSKKQHEDKDQIQSADNKTWAHVKNSERFKAVLAYSVRWANGLLRNLEDPNLGSKEERVLSQKEM